MGTESENLKNQDNFTEKNLRNQKRLVIATWVIAFVTLVGIGATTYFMHQNVRVMREGIILDYRPFANIKKFNEWKIAVGYQIGKKDFDDIRDISDVTFDSDAYKAINSVLFYTKQKIRIDNVGKTPMWLKESVTSMLFKNEWDSVYEKSPEALIKSLIESEVMCPNETDLVIDADSFFESSHKYLSKEMDIKDFEFIRDSTHNLIVYPFTVINYNDFQGNEYYSITINYVVIQLGSSNDRGNIKVDKYGLEAYRWDVKID